MKIEMKPAPKKAVARRGPARRPIGPPVEIDVLHEGNEEPVVVALIVTTEDKMRLRLLELLRSARQRHGWQTPAGMLVTEIATAATANFHETMGLSGQQWSAIFYVLVIVTVLWLMTALIRGWRGPSISLFIDSLKNAQRPADVRSK
jgi:hypothetical protein